MSCGPCTTCGERVKIWKRTIMGNQTDFCSALDAESSLEEKKMDWSPSATRDEPYPFPCHQGKLEWRSRVRPAERLHILLTLPTNESGGFSVQRVLRRGCVLSTLSERIGSGVFRPTVYSDYANMRSPSFKIFFAVHASIVDSTANWTGPFLHRGVFRSRPL